ncbi:hypothetical protein PTKIN_Ptkin16aG0021500 [Pterospermum kingtungense]
MVPSQVILVGWKPLPLRWWKLNSDGAAKMVAGCGGVPRDHDGRWVAGYACKLRTCDVFMAELWVVVQGLELAWHRGCRHLEVELDSRDLYSLMCKFAPTELGSFDYPYISGG